MKLGDYINSYVKQDKRYKKNKFSKNKRILYNEIIEELKARKIDLNQWLASRGFVQLAMIYKEVKERIKDGIFLAKGNYFKEMDERSMKEDYAPYHYKPIESFIFYLCFDSDLALEYMIEQGDCDSVGYMEVTADERQYFI